MFGTRVFSVVCAICQPKQTLQKTTKNCPPKAPPPKQNKQERGGRMNRRRGNKQTVWSVRVAGGGEESMGTPNGSVPLGLPGFPRSGKVSLGAFRAEPRWVQITVKLGLELEGSAHRLGVFPAGWWWVHRNWSFGRNSPTPRAGPSQDFVGETAEQMLET